MAVTSRSANAASTDPSSMCSDGSRHDASRMPFAKTAAMSASCVGRVISTSARVRPIRGAAGWVGTVAMVGAVGSRILDRAAESQ